MNRLTETFKNSAEGGRLNIYFTAGYPALNDTVEIMKSLETSGVDMIELGIPFSDPLADGPVIQQSSEIAIANGMNVEMLFESLNGFRDNVSIPVILMGYYNSVMQYGLERFILQASKVGIDGFIFPDVPPEEFRQNWQPLLVRENLCFSFLVTPETTPERVKYLDSLSSGFLYAVSSSSTTGKSKSDDQEKKTKKYLERLTSYKLKNPIMAGFGIKTSKDFCFVNSIVDGAIVGSAFIRHLGSNGTSEEAINRFVSEIKFQ